MSTHSSILAWRIPWTEEPGGLQSTGSLRVGQTEQLHSTQRASLVAQRVKYLTAMWETWVQSLGRKYPLEEKWQPTPVLLPGEFYGREAWWATVHGVAKSGTRLSDFTFTFKTNLPKRPRAPILYLSA